jgi:hypothetical protein
VRAPKPAGKRGSGKKKPRKKPTTPKPKPPIPRDRYGIPEDPERAESFIRSLMRHDVPRKPQHAPRAPRLKAAPPRCPNCRRWLAPDIDHTRCKESR